MKIYYIQGSVSTPQKMIDWLNVFVTINLKREKTFMLETDMFIWRLQMFSVLGKGIRFPLLVFTDSKSNMEVFISVKPDDLTCTCLLKNPYVWFSD